MYVPYCRSRRLGAATLILALAASAAFAAPEADPASKWLRADAPHAYLVRSGEGAEAAAAQFVTRAEHWDHVWCPWPGYHPPRPIAPGDLLVRVRINQRSWVQRARTGSGDRPHLRALEAYDISDLPPFRWSPKPPARPPQVLTLDLSEAVVQEPPRAVHRQVQQFWPARKKQSPVVRVNAGRQQFLGIGTALLVVPAGQEAKPAAWLRAVVAAVFPSYSYAVLLNRAARAAPGDAVRSPTAWCFEKEPAS